MKHNARHTAWLLPLLLVAVNGCWTYVSKDAARRFHERPGRFSVTVFPVNVVRGPTAVPDSQLARTVTEFIRTEGLAEPEPCTTAVVFPFQWRHNQAKMAQQSALAFGSWIKANAIQTDYALLAEILCNADETRVIGVHYYLADRSGLPADGGLTNSHWDEFKQVKPGDRRGGCEVLMRMLSRNWQKGH